MPLTVRRPLAREISVPILVIRRLTPRISLRMSAILLLAAMIGALVQMITSQFVPATSRGE